MTRKVFLLFLVLIGLNAFSEQKQNALVFIVDDLRTELGCYGSELVKSPNIDRLAEQGVLFDNAYSQEAICAPSRISILTGKRPDKIGIYSIFTPLRSVDKETVTIPQFFKEKGYTTVSVGKVYHHGRDDKENWSIHYLKEPNGYAKAENTALVDSLKKAGAKAKGPAFECADVVDEAYKDGRSANNAIEALHKVKDENFVMFVGMSKPHLPFNAPKKYWDLYDRNDFKVPLKKSPKGMSKYALTSWNELRGYSNIPTEGLLTDELSKELIHGYHACVSYTDAQIGKVINTLEELGLRENTMIILMSDHGWKLGEYGAWCKHTNFQLDVHVPMIVSRETGYKKRITNKRSSALVENVDLFATLADYFGLATHELDGKSMLPLVDNPKKKCDAASYSLYPRGDKIMGVTTTDGKWRYTEWRDSRDQSIISAELYPCEVDFMEQGENYAGNPQFKKVETKMRKLLNQEYKKDGSAFIYKSKL